jgi:hypothetical protein
VGPVLVYVNGCIRLSTRVFASAKKTDQAANIFMMEPLTKCDISGGGDNLTNEQNQVVNDAQNDANNAANNAPGVI